MPPFVFAECTNEKCRHRNRFDAAELRKEDSAIYKRALRREDEEFVVTCEKCGQKFKITLKGSEDGAKKDATRG